jgi:Zn-dependent metalloprotease
LQAATGGNVEVTALPATGTANYVRALDGNVIPVNSAGSDPAAMSAAFFAEYGGVFGIRNPGTELSLLQVDTDAFGLVTTRYQQVYQGIPVYGAVLFVHFNRAGQIMSANGRFVPDLNLSPVPALAGEAAGNAAVRAVAKGAAAADLSASAPALVIYHPGMVQNQPAVARLAYYVVVGNGFDVRQFVFVDAQNGFVLDQFEGIYNDSEAVAALDRTTYDMNNGTNYGAATQCRDEGGGPSGDTDCDQAHDFAGDTYNYYLNAFGRDSLDDAGMPLESYVHYDVDYVNAFWNGSVMTYGDSMAEDDVVAHELTHGVTEFSAGLIYAYQPGALNESYSDIFGETVDQLFSNGTTDSWAIGEDINIPGTFVGPFRDMANPNLFGDPARTNDPLYHCIPTDSGGVHINSGVPNKLYSLLVDGGTFNGQTVTGIGLTKAGAIHYRTLTQHESIFTDFAEHAAALNDACTALIGTPLDDPVTGNPSGQSITAANCNQVANAIAAVNLAGSVCQDVADTTPPALCSAGQAPIFHFSDNQNASSGWTVDVGQISPATTTQWVKSSAFAGDGRGQVWFAANAGNPTCSGAPDVADDTTLTSPVITIPNGVATVSLNLEHYFNTEGEWDGGIIEYSVNGGPYAQLPAGRLTVNGYNYELNSNLDGNNNPLALFSGNRIAFTGFNNPGDFPNETFLQSRANLTGLVSGGDTVRLRFHFGQDFCFGTDGWYIDTVQVYSCGQANYLPVVLKP